MNSRLWWFRYPVSGPFFRFSRLAGRNAIRFDWTKERFYVPTHRCQCQRNCDLALKFNPVPQNQGEWTLGTAWICCTSNNSPSFTVTLALNTISRLHVLGSRSSISRPIRSTSSPPTHLQPFLLVRQERHLSVLKELSARSWNGDSFVNGASAKLQTYRSC